MARNTPQLNRLLRLPCVGRVGDDVIIRFVGQVFVSADELRSSIDPVDLFIQAHERIKNNVRKAFADKDAVLLEIKNGTNRYRIDGGNFVDIGIDLFNKKENDNGEQ